ncbi:MAG: arsenosugar biosynthesis radical SAM (seleno)protein ArsS [bacterium]
MNNFERQIPVGGEGLQASDIGILQVNVGLRCNQQCIHCHLSCGPHRTEMMEWNTMELILEAAKQLDSPLVDITGGAPELNSNLSRFVAALRKEGLPVQVRTNLTALLESGMEQIPEFFRDHEVRLVASMPCYLEENVCAQRGAGVYQKAIEALKRLNTVGYGSEPNLPLNLVYNPAGPFLPPEQTSLEADYRRELSTRFGVTFSSLLTIANMPVGRFLTALREQNQEQDYMRLLKESFNPATVPALMCRHQVSVGWDGTLYDCDFNLALHLPVNHGVPNQLRDFDPSAQATRRIVTGEHCFGCTAGAGSSCKGALV